MRDMIQALEAPVEVETHCGHCQKRTPSMKKTSLQRGETQDDMMFSLDRFGGDGQKKLFKVFVPQSMPFGGATWALKAVISHFGCSLQSGHYVCHVRRASGWVTFNDNDVKTADQCPSAAGDPVLLLYTVEDSCGWCELMTAKA